MGRLIFAIFHGKTPTPKINSASAARPSFSLLPEHYCSAGTPTVPRFDCTSAHRGVFTDCADLIYLLKETEGRARRLQRQGHKNLQTMKWRAASALALVVAVAAAAAGGGEAPAASPTPRPRARAAALAATPS